jgi:hypothetical protein
MIPWTRAVYVTLAIVLSFGAALAGEKGAYYYELDAQVLSTITETDVGTITTVRSVDGSVTATLVSADKTTSQLSVDSRGALRVTIRDAGRKEKVFRGQALDGSLDWAANQLRVLYSDAQRSTRGVMTQDGGFHRLIVPGRRGIASQAVAVDDDAVRRVTTRFTEVVAMSVRHPEGLYDPKVPAFTAVIRDAGTGEEMARMAWFEIDQVLKWATPDEKNYAVTAEAIGGWKFHPTLSWANLQLFVFKKAPPAPPSKDGEGPDVVALDTIGCDGLHWLDDTIFRECCDRHDACYEKNGCTWKSWWFQGSWRCIKCNIEALICFLTLSGAGDDIIREPGGGDGSCQWSNTGCPAYCATCSGGPGGGL